MSRGDKIWLVGSVGVTALVLSIVMVAVAVRNRAARENSSPWRKGDIKATYLGSQLKEIDKAHSTLLVSYELENHSRGDYRLSEGSGVLILSRLHSDGSLSQEQPFRLGYAVFLPPEQHARLAIEITQPFAWPSQDDPAYLDKLREFVKRRLADVAEFVVFDQASHYELQLPGGWAELAVAAPAGG